MIRDKKQNFVHYKTIPQMAAHVQAKPILL